MLFSCMNITDRDVYEIMKEICTKESNEARANIIKMYTLETDLYGSINNASCTRDRSKIKTLGPFVYLLYCSLYTDSKEFTSNKEIKKLELLSSQIKASKTYNQKKN